MLVSIASYDICDGTLNGGVAISALRVRADRLYDFVVPVGDDNPILFDRVNTTADISFVVARTHASRTASETFILSLDNSVPASGTITLTTTGPTPNTRVMPNGALISSSLLDEQGCTTYHQYRLTGGAPVPP